jgi:hypothetical protein
LEYDLKADTCGLVISLGGGKAAADYDVPAVHVLVADTWKKMDVEIEWGFEQATVERDYSGRIETYDGVLAGLRPLEGDTSTAAAGPAAWRSVGKAGQRRGVRATLLYMGTSKWRKVLPFTSQADDVARTIVTVWTKSGSFSFLAADLENGPILAPEYGFFVRRTSAAVAPPNTSAFTARTSGTLLSSKMDSIAGSKELLGWGSEETPWFGGNLTHDVVGSLHAGNPHADDQGNADVWEFSSEESIAASSFRAAEPPIELVSKAASAREFLDELHRRDLSTIRQRVLAHEEQTWEDAVTALRGGALPAHPVPPAGFEPRMQVEVPCPRLTAQWNLGVWHLLRHCEKHPSSGRLWFNDYPYGILATETYLILAALDLMGSHKEAEDGFDQWVKAVKVNGKDWQDFDPAKETVRLQGIGGKVSIKASYR